MPTSTAGVPRARERAPSWCRGALLSTLVHVEFMHRSHLVPPAQIRRAHQIRCRPPKLGVPTKLGAARPN